MGTEVQVPMTMETMDTQGPLDSFEQNNFGRSPSPSSVDGGNGMSPSRTMEESLVDQRSCSPQEISEDTDLSSPASRSRSGSPVEEWSDQ